MTGETSRFCLKNIFISIYHTGTQIHIMFKLVFGYKYHKFYQSIESGLLTIFSFFNLGAFILVFSDLHIQKGDHIKHDR